VSLFSFFFLSMIVVPASAQNPMLQGGVQQNEAPFVDVIEAGNGYAAVADRSGKVFCDWMTGACDELHALVVGGGRQTRDCLDPLKQAVEFERKEHEIERSGENSLALARKANDLEQRRDLALKSVPHDCFAAGPHPNAQAGNEAPFVKGFVDGVGDCVGGVVTDPQNLAMIAGLWAAGKVKQLGTFVQGLGLVLRGGSIASLASMIQEPSEIPSADPYQIGRFEGKRFCNWELAWNGAILPGPKKKPDNGGSAMPGVEETFGSAGARNDCFQCTLAWLEDRPYTPPPGGGRAADLEREIEPLLKKNWGGQKLQGPPVPWWQQEAHVKGIPTSMSEVGIVKQMQAAGDGAKGIVFMKNPLTGEIGHIWGVKTVGSGPNAKVIFWDAQQQMDGQLWFPGNLGAWITFYRIQ